MKYDFSNISVTGGLLPIGIRANYFRDMVEYGIDAPIIMAGGGMLNVELQGKIEIIQHTILERL